MSTSQISRRLARLHQQEAGSIASPDFESSQGGPEHGSKPSTAQGSDSCSATHEGAIAVGTHGFGAVLPENEHWQISQKDTRADVLNRASARCSGTRDLVERTREAFLLQMAVDTRKADYVELCKFKCRNEDVSVYSEILKLHDKAARKAESLNRAETLLAKDAQRFDEFLRSSDAAAHDAICEWLKAQEEQSRERLKQQKHNWAQQQMQQQLQQHAAEMEAIEDEMREKLQELDKKKFRGSKADTRTEMEARLQGLEAVISELQLQLQQRRDKCKQHQGMHNSAL
ncbi:hypothetical protein Emag_007785 [Eimeria magna]